MEIAHADQCGWQTLLAKCGTKPAGELPVGRRDDDTLEIFLHHPSNGRAQLFKYSRGIG